MQREIMAAIVKPCRKETEEMEMSEKGQGWWSTYRGGGLPPWKINVGK